jgi:hypothetical protein
MQAEEWGTEIGRLFLEGKIPAELFETGKRWARMAARYRSAINAPKPDAVACSFEHMGKTFSPDPDSKDGQDIAESDRNAVAVMLEAHEMLEAHAVLVAPGMLAERAVRAVCERNESLCGVSELESLKTGLFWLAKHWGIIEAPKSRR